MAEHCPTCGQAVEVVTGGEGTSHYEAAETRLRAELDGIYSVVDHSDAALYDAVKKSMVRVTGSPRSPRKERRP